MTTFYNFALKKEISKVKKVVKPVLETWNATSDLIVYVWLIHFLMKIFQTKAMQKRMILNAQNFSQKAKRFQIEFKIKSTT